MNNQKSNLNSSQITLCICTMNRPDELNNCLASVFQNNELPNQIIVSDDSPDSHLSEAVTLNYPGVSYQKGPQRGLGANRNACIASTKSKYLIFIDDDVCVPTHFFELARQLIILSDSKTIITGYEMNYGGSGRWHGEVCKVIPQNPDFWGYQQVPVNNDYGSIVINSTIFPHSLFTNALFDEHLRYGSEEIDIAQHAISLGYHITYHDSFYVNHYPSDVNRDHYQQFIHASRLYATTKAYWQYEQSITKTLMYIFLAPLQLMGSAIRRRSRRTFFDAIKSTGLAGQYLWDEVLRVGFIG